MKRISPDSGVELNPFISKNYDKVMDVDLFILIETTGEIMPQR